MLRIHGDRSSLLAALAAHWAEQQLQTPPSLRPVVRPIRRQPRSVCWKRGKQPPPEVKRRLRGLEPQQSSASSLLHDAHCQPLKACLWSWGCQQTPMGFRYLDRIVSEDNIRSLLDLADLAAGGGLSADNVFELSHRLRKSNPMQVCQRLLARDPKSTALIQQRRLSGPYDPEALLALPKGSLGHTYAVVLKTLGDDINFFPKPEFYANLESDADYINYRVFATHDIHHIVSGFSLDNYGEMGVVSISVAQFAHPGLTFTDLMSLLLTWFGNDTPIDEYGSIRDQARTAGYAFGMISKGLQMGAEARPLFPVLWEERMAQNLQDLRAELGIEAVLEGPWSWASNPAIQQALGL